VHKGIAPGLSEVKFFEFIDDFGIQSSSLEKVDQVIIELCRMALGGGKICFDLWQINKKDRLTL
jgi:hypothetical protein